MAATLPLQKGHTQEMPAASISLTAASLACSWLMSSGEQSSELPDYTTPSCAPTRARRPEQRFLHPHLAMVFEQWVYCPSM